MRFFDKIINRLNSGHDVDLKKMGISNVTFLMRGAIVALTPKLSLLSAKMASGTMIRGRNRAGYGGRGVYMFREAVEPELALLSLILMQEDRFVDVGSCVGSYSVTAAHIAQDGGVIAIDPNPDAAAILTETAALNSLTNILVVCAAAANEVGFTQFSVEAARPDTRHIEEHYSKQNSDLHRFVPTTTIDHIVEKIDLPGNIRMIKIDAEGAEGLVLQGATQTLARFKPILIIETSISDIPILPNYIVLRAPKSRNSVLVHEGDAHALDIIRAKTAFEPLT